MDHLEYPKKEVWEERRRWFESVEEEYRSNGSYFVSEQACALIAEVQSVFCAGAWIAVIILSLPAIDSQLRETELPDFKGNTKELLTTSGVNPKLQKLRIRRNSLVHIDIDNPAITIDQQWFDREELEAEAKDAVRLMFEAFYISPGT